MKRDPEQKWEKPLGIILFVMGGALAKELPVNRKTGYIILAGFGLAGLFFYLKKKPEQTDKEKIEEMPPFKPLN